MPVSDRESALFRLASFPIDAGHDHRQIARAIGRAARMPPPKTAIMTCGCNSLRSPIHVRGDTSSDRAIPPNHCYAIRTANMRSVRVQMASVCSRSLRRAPGLKSPFASENAPQMNRFIELSLAFAVVVMAAAIVYCPSQERS